jgi:hypothetical protein
MVNVMDVDNALRKAELKSDKYWNEFMSKFNEPLTRTRDSYVLTNAVRDIDPVSAIRIRTLMGGRDGSTR